MHDGVPVPKHTLNNALHPHTINSVAARKGHQMDPELATLINNPQSDLHSILKHAPRSRYPKQALHARDRLLPMRQLITGATLYSFPSDISLRDILEIVL